MYEEVLKTVNNTREKHVPAFLEIRTYRYKGHSMSDPAKYRTPGELDSYKKQDPITTLKEHMLDKGMLTENEFTDIDKNCRSIGEKAVRFAEQSSEPKIETLYEDVLA